jgi:hypothetical protein
MKDELLALYERWLDHQGVQYEYKEKVGALAMLLWLRDKKLLNMKGEVHEDRP